MKPRANMESSIVHIHVEHPLARGGCRGFYHPPNGPPLCNSVRTLIYCDHPLSTPKKADARHRVM